MFGVIDDFLTRTRGVNRLHWTDVFTYLYLVFGTLLMFLPVVWLVLSSFKTPAALVRFPPERLPVDVETVAVPGYDGPLPLYTVTQEDGSTRQLAQVRRVGLEAQMVDPSAPEEIIRVPIDQRSEVRRIRFAWENYTEPLQR